MTRIYFYLIFSTLFCFTAFSQDTLYYGCLNVRVASIDSYKGEHSFLSFIKIHPDDVCDGVIGCSNKNTEVETFSLWPHGRDGNKWGVVRNQGPFRDSPGDKIINDLKNVFYIRECQLINKEKEVLVKNVIEEFENLNQNHHNLYKDGYYAGAFSYNCTDFSVEYFNKIFNTQYSAKSSFGGTRTPIRLYKEILESAHLNSKNENIIYETFIGHEGPTAKAKRLELERIREQMFRDKN